MIRRGPAGIAVVGLLLSACASDPPPQPPGPTLEKSERTWGSAKETQGRKYVVALETEPDPPGMSELFVLVATVTDRDGKPIENAKVKLNARMPQHNHGMMTEPKPVAGVCDGTDCRWPGGIYRSEGFKFHMGGEWTVTVEVDAPMGFDNTSFLYPMR